MDGLLMGLGEKTSREAVQSSNLMAVVRVAVEIAMVGPSALFSPSNVITGGKGKGLWDRQRRWTA